MVDANGLCSPLHVRNQADRAHCIFCECCSGLDRCLGQEIARDPALPSVVSGPRGQDWRPLSAATVSTPLVAACGHRDVTGRPSNGGGRPAGRLARFGVASEFPPRRNRRGPFLVRHRGIGDDRHRDDVSTPTTHVELTVAPRRFGSRSTPKTCINPALPCHPCKRPSSAPTLRAQRRDPFPMPRPPGPKPRCFRR